MLIQELRKRVAGLFARVEAEYPSYLPGRGTVIRAVRDLLLGALDRVQAQLEGLFVPGGDFDRGVEFVRAYAKGRVRVPWYVRLVADPDRVVDQVCDWLLANRAGFAGGLGDLR